MAFEKEIESSFFKDLVALSSEAIIVSDWNGIIVYVNLKATILFGYDKDEMIGEKIEILVPTESQKEHINLRKSYDNTPIHRPHGKGLDVYALKKSGNTFPAEISLSPIKYEDKKYTVSLVSDISERKNREQKIQNFIIDQQEIKRAHMQVKLEVLKNQISPHYLFNCLSILYPMIESRPKIAMKFTKKLVETYGYILETRSYKSISLKTEIDFLKNYIYLQKMRFGNTFSLSIHPEIEVDTRNILPLSIQTLVENVFKHNSLSEDNILKITITPKNLGVLVSNTRTKKKKDKESHGIGLKNLTKQYELISGSKPKITITDDQFSVWLPLFENEIK